jgi:membrane dipeptidase
MRLIIDTHLDLAWNALSWGRDITLPLDQINARESGMTGKGRGRATVSLPEMRAAGVAVCLATVLARVRTGFHSTEELLRTSPDFQNQQMAYGVGQGQIAYYRLLEELGQVSVLRSAADLDAHWRIWQEANDSSSLPVGFILAMEGADAIVEPAQAAAWYAQGMRAVGPVHYGLNRYSGGTGTSGPLTAAGVELLAEFDRVGMILDVTHLSEPAFYQALDRFGGPVLASHNNCRALVPGDRQFSDDQIRRLIDRQAVIGVALDAWMLHPNWQAGKTPPEVVTLESVADQIDHICQLAGNPRHAALGSDLDGGYGTEQTPRDLTSIADLQKIAEILQARGYADGEIDAVFHANWLTFLRRHLPANAPPRPIEKGAY